MTLEEAIIHAKGVAEMSIIPEEAIAILNDMKVGVPIPKAAVTQRKRNLALDMAISAMSCLEILDSSNCISRQAAIDALKNERSDWNCDYNVPVDHCIDAIYSLPSAQPEIIRCKGCRYSEHDALYDDRYCHYDGKADIVPDEHYCGYAERRTDGLGNS